MPLRQLSTEIIRLTQPAVQTPVLVTPGFLSVRPAFLIALIAALAEQTDRTIRIDWLRTGTGLRGVVGDRIAAIQAARVNRTLAAVLSNRHTTASIQLTASIGRPGGRDHGLVIGICQDDQPLPSWAAPIRLAASAA